MATAASDGINSNVDTSSALYVHLSDITGVILIPVQFDRAGYRSWRRGVTRALSVKNKLGFIDRSCAKPTANSSQLRQWQRCDDMVTSWILNSLTKEISDSVEYINNFVELWKELEARYDQTNGAKLYLIQKEINDLIQGTLDITVYYTRMKKLWEGLSTLNLRNECNCPCSCGAKGNMHKAEQDRRLIQFLMGLNEVYTVVRGNILMMNPLPSMAQAFSLLIQEEKQREFRPASRMPMESTSLNAMAFNNNNKGSTGRAYKINFPNKNYTGNDSNRNAMFCDFCKRTGHTKEKCYKLHWYPQGNNNQNYRSNASSGQPPKQTDYQNSKGKRIVANVHGPPNDMMPTPEEEHSQSNKHQNTSFTKDQYEQIMSMLQQFQLDNTGQDAKSSNENTNP